MMICRETFYNEELKGKTSAQIMTVIRGLKREIKKMKNIVEHPCYEAAMHPDERVRISCLYDYLERAKQALAEVGVTYVPSAAEQKAMVFDTNIPHINKVVFTIDGELGGHKTKTYTVDGDDIRVYAEDFLKFEPFDFEEKEIEKLSKEEFLKQLKDLRIGEWRRRYSTERFGYSVLDGTQWRMEIYYVNGCKPIKIWGNNAYPYNFDRVLEFFEMEEGA